MATPTLVELDPRFETLIEKISESVESKFWDKKFFFDVGPNWDCDPLDAGLFTFWLSPEAKPPIKSS
jgi:hypothetical protein